MKTVVFTLCSNNYLAHAKTLGDSVLKTNPGVHFIIGLVDKRDPAIDYDFFKPFEIIDYDQIGFPFFEDMLAVYNVIEFNTAVKPFFLEFLLTRHGSGSKIFYIDPDIVLYAGLDTLSSILEDNNIVLTPMLTVANETVTMDELVALRHGIYNLGFIGVKYSEETFRFVRWWEERLRKHCVIDKPRGLFVDQKWVDLAPLFFKGIHVFSDVGYNMAWWNFAERKLGVANGRYYVNAATQPLVFFHFSGFKPGSGNNLGRTDVKEYSMEGRPDLTDIFQDYAQRLYQNRYEVFKKLKPLLPFGYKKPKPRYGNVRKVKSKVKSLLKKYL